MKTLRLFPVVAALVLSVSVVVVHAAQPSSPPAAAITQAERAIVQHGYSSERLLALGRAQLGAGRIGPAVANLERGLVLEPRNSELRAALAEARAAAGIAESERTMPERLLHVLSLREWAALGATALVLLSLALLARALTRRAHAPLRVIMAVALVAAATSGGAFTLAQRELERAATVQESAVARKSPFAQAEATFSLRPGESVRMLERHGEYTYVVRRGGSTGWVASQTLAPLAADAAPAS